MTFTRSIFYTALGFLILAACDTSKSTSETPTGDNSVSLKYEMKNINRKAEDCQSASCAEVSINYPDFQVAGKKTGKINQVIQAEIDAKLLDYLMDTPATTNTESLINAFLNGYQEFKTNFPESISPWYLKVDAAVSYQSPAFSSIAISTSAYTGGAHPNRTMTYLNISDQGKSLDKWKHFFKDMDQLKEKVESQFRAQNNLSPTDNLADKGFMFENNTFTLSENFGFNSQGLIMYYNPYEIAPYSEGAIVVTLPFSEIAENFRY